MSTQVWRQKSSIAEVKAEMLRAYISIMLAGVERKNSMWQACTVTRHALGLGMDGKEWWLG